MSVDLGAFQETLRNTLSGDNSLRSAAEKQYEDAKRAQPTATVAALVQVVAATQVEHPLREQGAVLLRQCLSNTEDSTSMWSQIGGPAQVDVRAKLLQLLQTETMHQVRRKVADCIQTLGNSVVDIESDARPKNAQAWPELLPTLMTLVVDGSKDSGIRADCLWIVRELAVSVWQVLVASADQTYQVFHVCLADPSPAVRADAACLLCSLVDKIESREDRKPFAPLITEVIGAVSQLAGHGDPKHLNEVLQGLQATTEISDFFRGHISSHIMPLMSGIAKSHSDEASRKYAFEAILSFVDSKPKAMFKAQYFAQQAIEVCTHFLMQLNDDIDAWMADTDEEPEDEEEEHYRFGKEAVDRICRCASKVEYFPSLFAQVLKPAIVRLSQSGNWKEVVAGLSILAQIAEYIDDEATVGQALQAIKAQLAAAHPRVRYSAWGAVAQFAEDHAEAVSTDEWAAQFLPEFLAGLDDACQRVSIRSMEAFQHYGESVDREDLEPFLTPLMERLGARLQSGGLFQKKAITYIAVIAGQVEESFAPYYAGLMPILKQVIQNTLHKEEERTLLGKCFECISLLAKAVGRDGFRTDAELILQAMIQATQTPNLPSSDPVKEYMMAAAERICSTLKQEFLPFVPHILPGILEKLALAPREFDDNVNDLEEGDDVNLTLVQEGGQAKILIMYSADMQDLQGALECVHTFVEELGRSYAPYVAQTAQVLLPVFEFNMAEEIRDLAFETWGQLCSCAREDGQVQTVRELLMEFLKRVLPKLAPDEVDLMALKTRADGVTTCLRKAGAGILTAEQVQHICQVSLDILGESLKRRDQCAKEKVLEQQDEEAVLEDDEGTAEQSLRVGLCEIVGAIMQHHPDVFVAQGLPSYLALVQQLMQSGISDDRKLALFVACDFLDHLGSRITGQWPQFVPQMLEDTLHQDAELRQPACYGLSLAAKEQAFAPLAADAARRLSEVVSQSRKREKKKSERTTQACADNALSALVEILLNQREAMSAMGPQAEGLLWGAWLSGLPCREDQQEGVKNHRILLRLLREERPEVVGEGGRNIPKVLAVLTDLYKTDMVDEETSAAIGQLMLRVGNERLDQHAAQYSQKQRKKLVRIVEEAQKTGAAA